MIRDTNGTEIFDLFINQFLPKQCGWRLMTDNINVVSDKLLKRWINDLPTETVGE